MSGSPNPFEVFASAQAKRSEEYGQVEKAGREADRNPEKPRERKKAATRKCMDAIDESEDACLVKLNIMVTPQQKRALKQHALDTGMTASAIIRSLLAREMGKWDR